MITRAKLWMLVAGLTWGVAAGQVLGGDLNPPAGPVGPSMKPLSEVEPRTAINASNTPGNAGSVFKITQSGSYYLTGDLIGVAGKTGIAIDASQVTIDLNGFEISGGQIGIGAGGSPEAIVIRNGIVRACAARGVSLPSVSGVRVESLRVMDCGTEGISTSSEAVILHSAVQNNGGIGISVGSTSVVDSCVAVSNGSTGINLASDCQVINCKSTQNTGDGISSLGSGSLVSGCVANNNDQSGIVVGYATRVSQCTATNNGLFGISTQGSSTVDSCTVNANANDGIRASQSVVRACTANNNGDDGIQIDEDCTVVDCTSMFNVAAAASAGIYVTGTSNRIENNHLKFNDYGMLVSGADNVVAKNTARSNASGNFSVVAGNEFAPVITNPGSNGFATMTPWSNVAY